MSNRKKDEKSNEKDEKKGEKAGSSKRPSEISVKREKRYLRFQLPDSDRSEESFTSALSYNMLNDESEEPLQEKQVSVLQKFILTPLRHSQPRIADMNPCFTSADDEEIADQKSSILISSASSSKQLFEILRNSPTPSDADINLIHATYLRKLDGVKQAIENGADVNTFRDRQTPLLIAAEIGDDRLVAYLLTVPNINPDFQNVFGQTPLIVAVRNAFDRIVRLLLNHNANVNLPDHMGKTPLHGALFQKRPKLARLLLAYGADFEEEDCFGERPMYTSAVKKPHLESLMVLLRVGASPEYTNISGTSLFSRAILNWTEFNIIEALYKYGASVNSRDYTSGKTPLHFAAIINDVRIAKFLVRHGANTNVRTVYNFTAFDEAVFHRSSDVAEFLVTLTKGASAKMLQGLRRPDDSQ